MKGLRASNFKRIHLGLLLDLLLMFLVPAVIIALLALITRQVAAAGMDEATVETLLRSPTLAVRALYSFLVLQYCAAGLCALLTVSGIRELETGSRYLVRAKRAFLALTLTEAVAMLTHISDLLLPGGERVRLLSISFVAAILLILFFRGIALRALMLGCSEVLRSVGAQELSARHITLARHIAAAIALEFMFLLAALILALMGFQPVPRLLFAGAALALVYYVVVFLLVVRSIRKAADVIAAISE